MKKHKKDKLRHTASFILRNKIVLATVAGALTGLAVTYLLESEKGRSMLAQLGTTVKNLAGNISLPSLLRS